jgi:hypothetical protein
MSLPSRARAARPDIRISDFEFRILPALLLLLACAFANAGLGQDMVIYNGSLQSGWQNNGWAMINYANTKPVHSGTASISVTDLGTKYQALYLRHAPLNTAPYQSLSFWIYPTASGSNEVQVRAMLNGTAQVAVPLSFTAAEVNHWREITIPLASLGVAGKPAFNGFWIQNITRAPLTFYVDGIALIGVPAPKVVPLEVDPLNAIRTIDSRMYGINMAVWDPHLTGTATGPAFAAMGTGALRFPGGSVSDDYDWHSGLSVTRPHPWANNAGTFAKIVEARGAQAFITVNYGSGTPEEAAAWVAYYNGISSSTLALGTDAEGRNWKTAGFWASIRAASPLATDDGYNFLRISHPAPFGFTYWEIGNECYGGWELDLHGAAGSGLTGVAHDPHTYAEAFRTYYEKMMAVDPSIHIGAVSVPGEDAYGNGTHGVANPNEGNSIHAGWTPVVLGTLKSLGVTPQFLIHHSYPQNPGEESDAFLLQAGANLQADAANLRKMVADYIGATGSAMELDVTELNSVSSNPGKQSTSLVNGLFMADAVGDLAQTEFNACTWWDLRNGEINDANNNALLYGWRQDGDYGVLSSGGGVPRAPANTPYPTYYAAKLMTHWGRGGDTVVSATSGYALLSIYAARLQNGNLSLLVINKDPSARLPARIAIDNFTPGSRVATTYSYGESNDLSGADITTGTAAIAGSRFSYTFPAYSMTILIVKGER